MPSAVGEKTTASRDTPIDLRVLGETLCSIPASAATEREALQQLTQIIRKLTAATSASYFPTDAAASIVEGGVVTSGTLREEIETQTWKLASLSIGERSVQTARVSEGGKEFILSVPVVRPRHAVESICVVVSSQDPSRVLPGIVQILQIVAAFAAQWRGKVGLHDVHEQLVLYQRLTELLNEAVHLPTEDQFAEHITENIRHEFTAVAAAYVEAKRDGLRIMSISPARKFDRQSEFSKSIVAAADEVCVRAETDTKVQSFSLSEFNTAAAKKLTDLSDAKQVECLVLRDHDRAVNGFCILFCDTTPVRQLQDIGATLIGSYYEIYRKAKPGFVGRLLIAYRQAVRQRKLINIGLPILLAALLLMLPVPLKVKTNCTVQPETKRYISAPYEGRLEEVLVEPGDVVRKGDVLARMDARDIRWQLGVVEADYNQARKQWDAAMAPGSRDTSAAQIASFEMERLELKRNLLQDRIMNLDIKSPADGVVISGDPKKLEGARLTMGQTLAEVGPLDENMFELEIPDSDISYVNPGDVVRIKLHSMPGKTLTGSLDLIHPRAEQRGDKNVFIGDVRIDAAIDMENLRPGMKGTARITGPKCRLGWNLFHKSWEQVLFRIGW